MNDTLEKVKQLIIFKMLLRKKDINVHLIWGMTIFCPVTSWNLGE